MHGLNDLVARLQTAEFAVKKSGQGHHDNGQQE
jgi:hypothetical protein